MNYTFMFYKNYENVEGLLAHFETAIKDDPHNLIKQIDGELDSHYVHDGNNQWGRGLVAEARLHGEIWGLEAVRAEAVKRIRFLEAEAKRAETAIVSMTLINMGAHVEQQKLSRV